MPETRLIDANALRRRLIEGDGHDDDRFTEGFNFATQVYREYIDNATTIEAQPVKRGYWSECWRDPVRNVMSVICSACDDASLTYLPKRDLAVEDVPKKICVQMPYCPKCGAKMDGGDKDGE